MARSKVITVEIAEKQIREWEKIRDILGRITESAEDSIELRIVKKYLRCGSVADVAKELNGEGFLTKSKATGNPCKFSSNDVSDVIRSGSIEDTEMLALARKILQDHTTFMNRLFN